MRILVTSLALLGACSKPPEPQPSPAETAKKTEVAPQAESKAAAAKPKPLSEEDKRLIAMDPAELTPDMRRKRAYALRRKAMQNPDSAVARTLNDLQEAYQRGEIDPSRESMPTFTADGKAPSGGAPPAGARPVAETPAK